MEQEDSRYNAQRLAGDGAYKLRGKPTIDRPTLRQGCFVLNFGDRQNLELEAISQHFSSGELKL